MMFIERITLQNIKSYGSTPTTIKFKEGINLIAGANGAGKSTILEAIGFVLFDTLPYSQSDFERRGKSGVSKITIRLRSASDNQDYDVERAIPARYKVFNVKDHIDEGIQSKEDLLEWLCQHLKIEAPENLKPLFENTVGVQQGTITAVFLESASTRKLTFDSLLRVQDFEQAWNELGDTKKYITDMLNDNANEIARKEGNTERLPGLEISADIDRKVITDKEYELSKLLEELETLKIKLTQLDRQKLQLDTLNRQIEQENTNISHLQKTMTSTREDYKKSQQASKIVAENAVAFQLQNEAVERLKALEELRKQRDLFIENKRVVEKQIDSTKLQVEQLKEVLSEVGAADAQLIELEPLIHQQEQLEHELKQALEEQKELGRLQDQVTDDQQKREAIESELEELRKKVGERQKLAEQINQLRQQQGDLSIKITEFSAGQSLLEQALEKANQTFGTTGKRFEEYKLLKESFQQRQALLEKAETEHKQISLDLANREELDGQINDLDGQITQATGKKTATEVSLPRIASDLEELGQMREMLGKEEAVCPVCRRSMDGQAHIEAIDYYDTQDRKLVNERHQAEKTIMYLQASLEAWGAERAFVVNKRDSLSNQVALMRIEKEISELKGAIFELKTSLDKMEDAPIVHANAEATLNSAHDVHDQHNNRINKLIADRTERMQQIADFNEQLASLPSQDELQRRENEHGSLVDRIIENEKRLSEINDIDDKVRRLNHGLTSLDNPREKQAIARSTASKRKSLEDQHQEKLRSLTFAQLELETVQEKLQIYQNLDKDLEAMGKQRDDNAKGHQVYIENQQIADLLNEREIQLSIIQTELVESIAKRDAFAQQHVELTNDFDSEQYVLFKGERNNFETRQTELGAEIKHLKKQLADTEIEVEKLRAIVAQIQELQANGKRLNGELETFEFVRRSVRDAGPRIRKRKVQFVSEVAANYFSQIMNDFAMRLHWDADNYGIYIEQSGEKRPFGVLSGGEQMIAALSIRLALLTHMTRISLIFLDEPTINLDENRRIQLAERLKQIKGLQQLFIISHDDTFIGESNHVINVMKEDGVSRVEMSHAALY